MLSERLLDILSETKAASVLVKLHTVWYQDGWCVMRVHIREEHRRFFQTHTFPLYISQPSFSGNRTRHQSFTAGRAWRVERRGCGERSDVVCVSAHLIASKHRWDINDGLLCQEIRKALFSSALSCLAVLNGFCLKEKRVWMIWCVLTIEMNMSLKVLCFHGASFKFIRQRVNDVSLKYSEPLLV